MRKMIAAVIATALIGTAAHAGLPEYLDTVGTPTDGGVGPALWYQTARSPNDGSGGSIHKLTGDSPITILAPDYWDNADSAFGLAAVAWSGTSVIDSIGKFATGTNGTVSFLFKTPATLSGFVGLFNQGDYSDPTQLELGINGTTLRLGTQNGASKINTTLGSLSPDTWYFFSMRWDTSLPSNDLTWYYGAAGGGLNSGSLTITSAGEATKPIFVAGRSSGNFFTGGFFQSMAIYERTLSDSAIQSQFAEISTGIVSPSQAYADVIGDPADGGSGPALWYKIGRSPNYGSAGSSYTATGAGAPMTASTSNFWGEANSAFGLVSNAWEGAEVVASDGLFTSGTNGTFSFLFKTPTNLPTFGVMFSQTRWGGDSQMEVAVHNGSLRLGTQNDNLPGAEAAQTNYLGVVLTDTWYYFGATWDTSVSNLTWYYGEAGADSLDSGTVTITSAGSPAEPLYLGGRGTGNALTGAFYQHIAVYERTLSDVAMRTQFNAIPLPWRTSYLSFTDHYNITGEPNSAPEEDYDGDGQLNVYEYGLGGDPTDDTDVGTEPTFSYGLDDNVNFLNVVLANSDADITYIVEQTDDLVFGTWTNSGWNLVSTNTTVDPNFDEVDHRIDGSTKDNLFIRLRITQP